MPVSAEQVRMPQPAAPPVVWTVPGAPTSGPEGQTGRRLPDPATAPERTRALIARMVAVLRIVQLVPWPLAVALGSLTGVQNTGLAISTYAVQTAWSLVWVAVVLWRRQIPAWAMGADLAVAAAALVAAGMACNPIDATSWANSAVAPAVSSAAAAATTWRRGYGVPTGIALAGAYVVGISRGIAVSAARVIPSGAGDAASMVIFSLVAGIAAGYLIRQAEVTALAATELAEARARIAAEESRDRERARQYRMLHDTVLSTLSALARGGLDPSDPLVRQRCAADADYLRGLISSGGVSSGNQLQGELAAVGRSQAALGLRVHVHCADVPVDLPETVVRSIADATREALNNVIKHARVDQAWVTALASDGAAPGVLVTIADRGRGFNAAAGSAGLGLRDSIGARLAEVGGTATVDSRPGQGTSVELRWPG